LAHGGVASNFVIFRPKKSHVGVEFRIPRSEELNQRLEDSDIEMLSYDVKYGNYRIRVDQEDLEVRADLLRDLAQLACQAYGDL